LKTFLHKRVEEVAEQIVAAMNAATPSGLIVDTQVPVRESRCAVTW
jgi:hypothetical protein